MPPFAALRAFHAAAGNRRFRDAAAELGLTESAVSHQVRKLEDFLHVQLFSRNGPRVELTEAGRRYFEEIDPAMIRIREATAAMLTPRDRTRAALTLPPSLAIFWLIPNLSSFEAEHRGIGLELVPTTRVCDLRREQIDLAIRHGRGQWNDVDAEFLLGETTMPVAKPGYIARELADDIPAALAASRLIIAMNQPEEWPEWAQARGVVLPPLDKAIRLETAEQVLEVAARGHGIAMGRRPVVDQHLDAGTLVAPFGEPDPSDRAYYLCRAKGVEPSAASRAVARWLKRIASETESAHVPMRKRVADQPGVE